MSENIKTLILLVFIFSLLALVEAKAETPGLTAQITIFENLN